MKLIQHVNSDKLRGGYYTPDSVVDWCVDQVTRLMRPDAPGTWLEPSAGDGAFLRGIARLQKRHSASKPEVYAVELIDDEAAKCERVLEACRLAGQVTAGSFFDWARDCRTKFDAVVGNPPYVRYQFVPTHDRIAAEGLMADLGIELRGVSNLWIPFAVLSIAALRPGGAFSLVLPSELFSTVSGGQFRAFVVRECTSLRVDLFPRDTFPDILQDVVIVSGVRGRRPADRRTVIFCEHRGAEPTEWKHTVEASPESWLRHLLTKDEIWAYCEANRLAGFYALGDVAKIGVSIVTGANPFFTIDDATVEEFGLQAWTRPLLARTSDCPGIVFTEEDHAAARRSGSRAWLLDFSDERPSPSSRTGASRYLRAGEAQGLPQRFKCRIRTPWYRVPQIKSGRLMMTKRAHHYHRLILNEASVFTTDTIYRGEMRGVFADFGEDLVAGFQNSVTLLSSEIEGRTYGGGVLELIPSEIARLRVPLVRIGHLLPKVDAVSRLSGGQRDTSEAVLSIVDTELCRLVPGLEPLLPLLRSARLRLRGRRMNIADEPVDANPED